MDNHKSGVTGDIRVVSHVFDCVEKVIYGRISIAVGQNIVVGVVKGGEEVVEESGIGEAVLPTCFGEAAPASVIGVVGEVIVLVGEGYPIRLSQQGSVGIDRTVYDELCTSNLHLARTQVGYNVIEVSQTGR